MTPRQLIFGDGGYTSDEWATTSDEDEDPHTTDVEPNAGMAYGIVTEHGLQDAPPALPLPGLTRPPRNGTLQARNLNAILAAVATNDDWEPGNEPDEPDELPQHQA